jgi:carbon-monoxide dehydrogenase large subunit
VVAYNVVGQQTSRVEGPEKVSGRAVYGIDALLPGTLWCKVLRSPYPHARIVSVDATKARQLPGVHAVLTGADVQGMRMGGTYKDEPILAWDRVLFVGDKVAAVAAEDEDIAQRALDLIEVEYEELPAVFDAQEAARSDAPLLHPEFNSYRGVQPLEQPSNVYGHLHEERGSLEEGWAAADVIVERTYRTQWTHQGYLEPHCCLVWIDPEGQVQLWVSSQGPFNNRNELARVMGLSPEQVNVNFCYVGGSFGGKTMFTGVPLCYLLAKATGRPVKAVLDYSEELMAANPRHPTTIRIKAGARRDGTLTAWQAEAYLATGAYAAYAPVRMRGVMEVAGPYKIPHLRIDSYQAYTNTVPCGFMRAPGEVQGIFAGESHMDVVARELGMDPLEFRLRNIVHEGDELPSGQRFQGIRLEETLRAAAQAADYFGPKPPFVGRGIALGHRSQPGGAAHAAVELHPDGRIIAYLPSFDQGGGLATVLALVVAEELGVVTSRVTVAPGAPFDVGTGGSRGTRVTSAAGHQAALDLKQKLQRLAAEFLGWAEERMAFRDGFILNTGTQERVPLEQIAARAGGAVMGASAIEEPASSPYTSFAAHIAEVHVDPETGQVTVTRYTAGQDTGQVLNRLTFQGQVEGGVVYALGQTLMEELVMDQGRVTNPSFADFKLPTVRDIPTLQTVLLESAQGDGPYNVRGIGEHSNITVAPAIANAIADACGARVEGLPITAEKVYQALRRGER